MIKQVSSKPVCSLETWRVSAWTCKKSYRVSSWLNASQEFSPCSCPRQIFPRSSRMLSQPLTSPSKTASRSSRPSRTLSSTWRPRSSKQEFPPQSWWTTPMLKLTLLWSKTRLKWSHTCKLPSPRHQLTSRWRLSSISKVTSNYSHTSRLRPSIASTPRTW